MLRTSVPHIVFRTKMQVMFVMYVHGERHDDCCKVPVSRHRVCSNKKLDACIAQQKFVLPSTPGIAEASIRGFDRSHTIKIPGQNTAYAIYVTPYV